MLATVQYITEAWTPGDVRMNIIATFVCSVVWYKKSAKLGFLHDHVAICTVAAYCTNFDIVDIAADSTVVTEFSRRV
jgi:hypothetical protein